MLQACRLGGADALVRVRPANHTDVCWLLEASGAGPRQAGVRVFASVRPECLRLHRGDASPTDRPSLRGTIAETTYLGAFTQFRIDCAGTLVTVLELRPRHGVGVGEPVAVTADPADVVLLDA